MKRFLTILVLLFVTLTATAQDEKSIIIDQNSFRPVQTGDIVGLPIDPIAIDTSRRPCARIKVKINRMGKEEINKLEVKIHTNNELTKCKTAEYANGLIIEMTAKAETRFYFNHPEFGQSNEVILNLDPNKEYYMEASLNQLYSIIVNSNVADAEVYLDNVLKGRTGDNLSCTISDVMIGSHKLKLAYGKDSHEQSIEVNKKSILFRQDFAINVNVERFDVRFKITPANAIIVVDGMEQSVKNGELNIRLSKSSHSYYVSAKEYHPQSGSIVVNGNMEQEILLKPTFGWLSVDGQDVKGATVKVGDEVLGIAPIFKRKLTSGTYTISINKDMYKPYEDVFEIKDDSITKLTPSLIADFATVTLSTVQGAEIWVNDQKKGVGSWVGKLKTGSYIFETRKEGCYPQQITQNIDALPSNQKYALNTPIPIMGSIKFRAIPVGAKVRIDGDKVNVPENLQVDNIQIGTHKVEVSKTGYETFVDNVIVKKAAESTVNVRLKRMHKYRDGFNFGLTADVSYLGYDYKGARKEMLDVDADTLRNSAGLGIGATFRLFNYNSRVMPTIALRYVYGLGGGSHRIGIPLMINWNYKRPEEELSLYSGVGLECVYFKNLQYAADPVEVYDQEKDSTYNTLRYLSGWALGSSLNIIGFSDRHNDMHFYFNCYVGPKYQGTESNIPDSEGAWVALSAVAGLRYTYYF